MTAVTIDFSGLVDPLTVATWLRHNRICGSIAIADVIADQIEAQTRPTKPGEPLGLGAVVEDERGELWVRDKTTTTVAHWKRARGGNGGKRYRYDNIDAAKVLSEGVTS